MNLDFKRFLSSVMALVMICSTLVIGNGTAVFADEPGEMSITDVTVEESAPVEDNSATDVTDTQETAPESTAEEAATDNDTVFSEVVDDEPLFINLGIPDTINFDLTGGTVETEVTDLAATGGTWTASGTDTYNNSDFSETVANIGDYALKINTVGKSAGYLSNSATNNQTILVGTEKNKIQLQIALSKGDKIKVNYIQLNSGGTSVEAGTLTITDGVQTATNTNTKADALPYSLEMTAENSASYTISSDKYLGIFGIEVTPSGSTPSPTTYTVSVNESPADGGTFSLTNGTINCTDDSASNTFPAGDVTLTVTPADGYEVDNVKVGDDELTITDGTYKYTVSSDIVITITYKEKAKGTITADYELTPANLDNNPYFSEVGTRDAGTSTSQIRVTDVSTLSFTVADGANVYITAASANQSNTDARVLSLLNSSDETIASGDYLGNTSQPKAEKLYASNLAAGTYTIKASSHINVFSVKITFSEIETSTEASSETTTEAPTPGTAYTYNFSDTAEQDSDFFTIVKTTSGSFGTTTYNSKNLTTSVKTDSNLNITFSGAGKLVLVTKYDTDTVGGATINVDGNKYTADSNGIITVSLTDGTHAITRNSSQSRQHGLFYIEFTPSSSSEEPEEGTLTVKLVNAPQGTTYKLLDGTTELTNNGTADTYTLQTNKSYTVQPTQVDHNTVSIMYGSTDITNTDTFVFHSNINELTITYTPEPTGRVNIYVSGQDQIPYINNEPLTNTGITQDDGSKLYTFTNYVNTAYTISAPAVPGYNLSITIDNVETTSFVISDGLVININYTEKQSISNVSWNFNTLASISQSEVNDLGDNLTYNAGSSDSIDSQNTNTFTTAIGEQNGKGIRPGGNSSYTNRYFKYDLAPGATFTLYYVMVANSTSATITDAEGNILATGNTVSDKTTLGKVTYTNTTDDIASIRAFAASNKPSFIGATVSGETEAFTIAGTVYEDGTTNPIANATVTPDVAGVTAVTTDENGNYSFSGVTFTGAVKLTVTADNYLPTTIGSFVSSTTSADAYLKKITAYNISGKVVDESGTTLANAVVTLGSQKVITNSSGTFEFTNVTGAATLTVTLSGYKTVTYNFKGDGTETTTGLVATLTSPIVVKFRLTGVSSTATINITSLDNTSNSGSFTKNITGKDYGLTFEAAPGERIKFTSKSTDVYEWHPIVNDVADTEGRDSILFHAGSAEKDRYFIYTVPENAEPDMVYGVEFIGTSGAGHTINPDAINEGYNLTQSNEISYGQYGFGNDKIRVNAGKPTITDKATIEQLASQYSARTHMNFAFANPTLNDFTNGFSHDQFNVIDNTGKPNVANQYGILDGNITANSISNESFISFKPVIEGKDTVTVTIDASATAGQPSYTITATDGGSVSGAASKTITASGKQSVELAVGYTYKITDTAGDSKQTYIKSIRIFDPNNVFATIADTNVTYMSAAEPNFYTEDMGSVDTLKDTAFGQALGLTEDMSGMNVYRVVARIYVPEAEQAAPEQFIKTINSVGFDVYKSTDYNTIDDQTSTGNHYNANQAVNNNYHDLQNTMETNKGEIVFNTYVNPAVIKLTQNNGNWENAGDLNDNSAMLFGSVGSTKFEDLYVQTFIATNQSLTLVPYTESDSNKKYTICKSTETNVTKTIGPSPVTTE